MKINELFSKIGGGEKDPKDQHVIVSSNYDKMLVCIALKILSDINEEERKLIDEGKMPSGISGAVLAALDQEKIRSLKNRFDKSVGKKH